MLQTSTILETLNPLCQLVIVDTKEPFIPIILAISDHQSNLFCTFGVGGVWKMYVMFFNTTWRDLQSKDVV